MFSKKFSLWFILICGSIARPGLAQESDSVLLAQAKYELKLDSINNSFIYQTGRIHLKDFATLTVPKGYKYLDVAQSQYVLTNLWGNPPDSTSLGMLFRQDLSPLHEDRWAIDITYSKEGFIDDNDAEDIDYDDLLADMQKDVEAGNAARKQEGYESIHFVGWASPPFYDDSSKKLHWAKEITFGDSATTSTLNYNVRILGRNGYLVLNAIGNMHQLPEIKKDINSVIASAEFNAGYKYADFKPEVDHVAAYGIGGLIAGKVLAKAGIIGILAKAWKLLLFGAIAAFAYIRKKIFGPKQPQPLYAATNPDDALPGS